jgi:hypothetical protein
MRRNLSPWTRKVCAALVVLLGLALSAPPAFAEQTTPAQPSPLAAAAEAKVATLDPSAVVTAPQAPAPAAPTAESGKSFFKTKKGAAALVLFVGVAGWTLASRLTDAIQSPAR